MLFPDHDSLSRTYEYCTERGLSMDIQKIYDLDEGRQGRFRLTDDQQDILAVAFDRGYYKVPRRVTLSGIADEFDVSHQALSERLRRAHENLINNTVIIGGKGVEEPLNSE